MMRSAGLGIDQSASSLAAYAYLGSQTIVQANSAQPAWKLTYMPRAANPLEMPGSVHGTRPLRRVVDNRWIQSGSVSTDQVRV